MKEPIMYHGMIDIKELQTDDVTITQIEYDKLKTSLTEFPEMLFLNPVIIDETNGVLRGNKVVSVLRDMEMEQVPYFQVESFTDKEKQMFKSKSNWISEYGTLQVRSPRNDRYEEIVISNTEWDELILVLDNIKKQKGYKTNAQVLLYLIQNYRHK